MLQTAVLTRRAYQTHENNDFYDYYLDYSSDQWTIHINCLWDSQGALELMKNISYIYMCND